MGKIETLGSIFSNETRKSEAACVLRYNSKRFFRPHTRLTNPSDPMVLIRLVQNQMQLTALVLKILYELRFDT